jgi:negative regulator of flagellin synthesis FlgM
MKIEQSTALSNVQPANETRSVQAKKTVAASDEVELSSLASQLATSSSEPTFDAARVAEIRQAITDGKFTVNTGAIADRLIASAKELIGTQR